MPTRLSRGPGWGRAFRRALLAGALGLAAAAPDPANIGQGLSDFAAGRFAEALSDWRNAAAAGDATGDLYIGVMYDTGEGVPQDYAEALDWYRRAAQAGSAAGAFNVGVYYDSGLGLPADPHQAALWYGRAAAKGFARAQYNLALMYQDGVGVPRDRGRATALFRQAAAQGLTAAKAHLAALGEPAGRAPVRPPEDAMAEFRRAQDLLLNRGAAEAANVAGLFRHAADRRNAVAEYDLGYCYEHGVGVPQDPVQAYAWYQRALADTQDGALRDIAGASAGKLEQQIAGQGKPGAAGQKRPGG